MPDSTPNLKKQSNQPLFFGPRKTERQRLTARCYYTWANTILQQTQICTSYAQKVLLEHANLQIKSETLFSDYPMDKIFSALCIPDSKEIAELCYSMEILDNVALNLEQPLKFFQEYLRLQINPIRDLDKSLLKKLTICGDNVAIFAMMTNIHCEKIYLISGNLRSILQMQTTIWDIHTQNLQARLRNLEASFTKPTASVSTIQARDPFTPVANNALRHLPPYVKPLPSLPSQNIETTDKQELESSSEDEALSFDDETSHSHDALTLSTLRLHMWKQQHISN